jgi:hypothetical protein
MKIALTARPVCIGAQATGDSADALNQTSIDAPELLDRIVGCCPGCCSCCHIHILLSAPAGRGTSCGPGHTQVAAHQAF